MQPILTDWTVVVVGSWNLAILNPEWFGREVFEADQIEAELLLEGFVPQLRFTHGQITAIPRTDRLIFGIRDPGDATLGYCESIVSRLLDRLPVTPISAIGVNYAFSIEDPSQLAVNIFQLSDLSAIADKNLTVIDTKISRTVTFEDRQLNLTMHLSENGSIVSRANFHKSVGSASEARLAIGGKLVPYKQFALNLTRDIYESTGGNSE